MSAEPVTSPCIKICTMDPSGAYCLGCFRTLEEIGYWSRLSEPQRRNVMGQLPARKALFAQGALQRCERCGVEFPCGAKETSRPCWCMSYPALSPAEGATGCMCPACLSAATDPTGVSWASD